MKVFDCFTFFNELDLLELRFEILDKYVDFFIIIESRQTFSGQPKPLYYREHKERFAKWNNKIINIVVPDIEVNDGILFRRHYLCYETIEGFLMDTAEPDDVAFCSDLDEIWNPSILEKLDDLPHSLRQHNYSYWLNYLSNEEWTGTLMSKVKNVHIGFNKRYRTIKPNVLLNGGWHFTNMGGEKQIIKKLEAYDHSNEVLPILSQFEGYGIKDRMDKGLDFLGREFNYQGVPYVFEINEEKWPEYLKENKDKYIHLCKDIK